MGIYYWNWFCGDWLGKCGLNSSGLQRLVTGSCKDCDKHLGFMKDGEFLICWVTFNFCRKYLYYGFYLFRSLVIILQLIPSWLTSHVQKKNGNTVCFTQVQQYYHIPTECSEICVYMIILFHLAETCGDINKCNVLLR